MIKLSAYGQIKEGKLTLANRKRFEQELASFPDCAVELIVKKKNRRSTQQNRYLFGVVYKEMEIRLKDLGNDVDTETIHEWCKQRFNPKYILGVGGEILSTVGDTTTEMNKSEFSEYVDKIIRWCASNLELSIPAANSDLQLNF